MKNSRFKTMISVSILLGLLGSCKRVDIPDGRIPAEYLEQAKLMAGKYQGKFSDRTAQIQIYFEGDKPRIKYSDALGNDPLEAKCQSEIGDIKQIVVSEKNKRYELEDADFAFSPGNCTSVVGRYMEFHFKDVNHFSVRIHEFSSYVRECDSGSYPYPNTNCHTRENRYYIDGKFVKVN